MVGHRRIALRLTERCTEPWSAMHGDGQRRHCASCSRSVHNLTAISRRDAERLAELGVCGHFVPGDNGEPIHSDRLTTAGFAARVSGPALAGLLLASCATPVTFAGAQPTEVIGAPIELPDLSAEALGEGECDEDHVQHYRGVIVADSKIVINEKIQFGTSERDIPELAQPLLNEIAKVLEKNPSIRHMKIVGHTDNVGTEPLNRRISRRRAEAVRRYLVKRGVDGARLSTDGVGSVEPIAANDTELGRARNRRVEFVITDQLPDEHRRETEVLPPPPEPEPPPPADAEPLHADHRREPSP